MTMIPDPRVPMLSAAIADLVAGYEQVRAVLDGYEAPEEVQQELLEPLRSAAERATSALSSVS